MEGYPSILKLTESWQKAIVAELAQQSDLPQSKRDQTVFCLILIILCLYLCDCRQLIPADRLQALQKEPRPYHGLIELWQLFCHRFGSHFLGLELSPKLVPSDRLLREMLNSLYAPDPTQFSGLSIEILAQVYEQMIALEDKFSGGTVSLRRSRKSGGIYYTPKPIVQYMVKSTIDRVVPPPFLPNILDPSCGGGAFLIEAYQYLLDRQRQYYLQADPALQLNSGTLQNRSGEWQLSFAERQRILQYIHGVDVDARAVIVTRLSLWLKLLEDVRDSECQDAIDMPDLNHQIRCGNALVSPSESQPSDCTSESKTSGNRAVLKSQYLNWQTAFPEVLANGGFEVVIGNPPYVDAETMAAHAPEWRSYCTAHYQTATGNWDLFCIFIEKALQLCRFDGLTSLIVPNKLLSANYASAARLLLTQTSHLLSIRDYSLVPVFKASVYPIVYLAQKHSAAPANSLTLYEQMESIDQIRQSHTLSLNSHPIASTQSWSVNIHIHRDLFQRLDRLPKLKELMEVTGAATVAEAYLLQSRIQDQPTPTANDLRIINSGTIDRYCLLWGQKCCRYLGQSYQYPIIPEAELGSLPAKRLAQARHPKIIVAGMARRLECALDPIGNVLAGKSTSVIQVDPLTGTEPLLDLRYVLGILNSRLISFYFLTRFDGNRLQGGYVRIGPPQLREMPILLPNLAQSVQSGLYTHLIELVDQWLQINSNTQSTMRSNRSDELSQIQQLDREIDTIIYRLYQLTDLEISNLDRWTQQ